MKPAPYARLILLPRDPARPARCLHLDAAGRVVARQRLEPSDPPPPATGARDLVVVPGEAVRTLWLDLPAHNPVQALAAARILLQDHLAGAGQEPHIALGAPAPSGAPRLVAVVDDARMREWLQRCERLGIAADALFPEQLLLPEAATEDGPAQAAAHDGVWLVRGPRVAFAAEPELARRIVAGTDYRLLEDPEAVEALFGQAAVRGPALDLLQYAHARRRGAARPGRRRRIAVLAALCLLSPLVLLGAQTARHALAARWLEQRADALAAARLPQAAADDASAALHARYRRLAAPAALAVQATALFDAIAAVPGARLDSLDYATDTGLRAGLLHAGEADLDALRGPLAAAGLELSPLDSQAVDGGLRSGIALEPSR